MIIMFRFYTLFCLLGFVVCPCPDYQNLVDYWAEDEPLKGSIHCQRGRTCDECNFPFTYAGELHYGCRPDKGGYHNFCETKDGSIKCSSNCPTGSAKLWKFVATANPDGDSFSLHCYGWSSPKPTITIYKDGRPVHTELPSSDPYPETSSASIIVRYTEDDYGTYKCSVTNSFSNSTSNKRWNTYHFNGERLPGPPQNVRVLSTRRTYVTLGWDEPEESGGNYVSYELQMTPGKSQQPKLYIDYIHEKSHTIKQLQPGVEYSFQVRRETDRGISLWTDAIRYTVPADAAVDKPVNLTATDVKSTSITLEFDFDGEWDKRYYYSHFYFTPLLQNQNKTGSMRLYGQDGTIEDLIPSTQYKIEVETSVGDAGERRSEPIYVTTLPLAPVLKNLTVDDEDHYVVRITCEVIGGPPPNITWKLDNGPLQPTASVNTTALDGVVTSVLILTRDPFVYKTYTCEARNEEGHIEENIRVGYTGNHPPAALMQVLIKIQEDLEAIKKKLE